MFVPFLSAPSVERRKLWRRKGGGGGGGGGGRGGGGGGGGGTKSSGGSSSGSTGSSSSGSVKGGTTSGGSSSRGSSISSGGTSKSASTSSSGTKSVSSIPAGQAFAGRSVGGGTRSDVYGSRAYGSGYPGIIGKGTAGRGFPFFFWPIAFGAGGLGAGAYLHNSDYGSPNNSSRPGGAQLTAAFTSNSQNTTYRILSDNTTVTSLIESVVTNCGSSLSTTSITPSAYEGSNTSLPKPEQVIQYYRASTVALSLDGYNNTGALSDDNNAPDTPLLTNIDTNLLNCMNSTIGNEVPLVSGDLSVISQGVVIQRNMGLLALGYAIWTISELLC